MAKRLRGEGNIRERKDGRWEVRVRFPDGRRSKFTRTKTEAVARLQEMQREAAVGAAKSPARLTVSKFLADWLETTKPSVRPSTWSGYESIVRLHIVPPLGEQRLAKLTPRDVHTWLAALQTDGLSPRMAQLARTVLRSALQRGVEWGDVQRNVVDLVRGPKVERQPVSPWSADEAEQFIAASEGDYLEALWVCAITLGLRQGELLGLRWSDVDLDGGELRVVQARLRNRPGEPMFGPPKSKQARRVLPLPAKAVDALREHRRRQLELRLTVGPEWTDSGLVFTTHAGGPLEGANVSRSFRGRVKRYKMRPTKFHDLRHCCASLLLSRGVSLREIMEWLGHSQIALTANTYTHVMPALQRDAADRMDSIFDHETG